MTVRHYNQMIDLSQEDTSTMMLQDGINEPIECMFCEGNGCKECNFTGLEYPEEC